MKKFAIFALLALLCSSIGFAETTNRLEAFPGAEGYGRYTSGGRGGKVLKVTKLADDGSEGTLRWACNQSGTRTIVFDVSGTIHLTSALTLDKGNVTIAGQTAPGDGICIADYPFEIKANNVIIRFVRFRLGSENVLKGGADGWDGLGALDRSDIIIDHCSVSWSIDECLSFSGTHNTTVQWCIVSQSLVNAGHSKDGHGYGGNWGGEYGSYHHNLLAHHTSRAPRLGPRPSTQMNEYMDMRNNVMFNYSGEGCYGGEGMNINIVNNYYQPGPGNKYLGSSGSSSFKKYRIAGVGIRTVDYCIDNSKTADAYNAVMGTSISSSNVKGNFNNGKIGVTISGKSYEIADDNTINVDGKTVTVVWNAYKPALHKLGTYYVDGNNNHNLPEVANDNWGLGMYDQITWDKTWDGIAPAGAVRENLKQNLKLDRPIDFVYTTTHSAKDAYENVLAYAGASLKRDALDAMIVNEARTNTAASTGVGLDDGFINTPKDIKYPAGTELDGYLPKLNSTEAALDTDGDGMPDYWEDANGLDKNNASDATAVTASGYTNIELYINSLVEDIMVAGNNGGKMLNGDLTFADDAVELPKYEPSTGDDKPVEAGDLEINYDNYTETSNGAWHFGDGISILTNKDFSSSKGVDNYIKFSRNTNFTIVCPEGLQASGITFNGYSNAFDDARIAKINDEDTSSELVFPTKTKASENDTKGTPVYKEYEKTFTTPVSSIMFRPEGQQIGLKMTVHLVKAAESGIEDIVIDQPKGNGKIYNIMGVEVKEPLLPGIYIRDGKKFLVK